jgi:hypothetical protein
MRVSNPSMDFYDFEEYEQLIAAARKRSSDHLAFVLLGGDAGCGLVRSEACTGRRSICVGD